MKPKAPKHIIRKILKWLFISLSALIVCFIIFALIVGFFYQDKVKKIIVDELNKNLRTEIKVKDIDFSLFRKFPYATLTFNNLSAKDATEEKKDTLLKAEKLLLNFNIIDIFQDNYRIKEIDLVNARLNLKIYNDNTDNYTFWKKSTDTTSSSFKLELKKINCNNVQVRYTHAPLKQLYDLKIIKGVLSGKFYDNIFKANVDADAFVNDILIDDLHFLEKRKVNISLSLKVNNEAATYNISEGQLCVGRMCFGISGIVNNKNEKTKLDLSIKGKEIDLPAFIEELPEQYKSHLTDYKTNGIIHFDALIKGMVGKDELPNISIVFGMKDGSINQQKNNITLNGISFDAHFNNGEKHNLSTYKLLFENFKANMTQGSVNSNFSVEDFDNPLLKVEAKANINLSEMVKFLNVNIFDEIAGDLTMNFMFSSKINDFSKFKPEDFINSKCNGNAQLRNASFSLKEHNKKFKNINGNFQFNNNDIVIDSLKAATELSDFWLHGYFRNALSFIFIPAQKISVDAGLISNKIVLDELLFSSVNKNDTVYKMQFSKFIDYNLDVKIKQLHFRKFEAQNLKGKFQLKNKILTAENFNFDAFDGNITASANIDGIQENVFITRCKAKLQKTDINKMFYQLENFGQNSLSDKNIKGKLTADIDFLAKVSSALNIDMKSIYSYADIAIENGELIDYAPIKKLSQFIKVNDLSHIKFQTLKNHIEIKNQTINIPNMSIKSDAINIEAMGTHTFDNKIDYRLRILLSDLLGKKVKKPRKEDNEFGTVEEDGLGHTTIFLKITGTVDNPITSYDTKGVFTEKKAAVKEDVKNTIKKIGEELFNKRDTVKGLETEKQKKKKKKKKEDEILDDFKVD